MLLRVRRARAIHGSARAALVHSARQRARQGVARASAPPHGGECIGQRPGCWRQRPHARRQRQAGVAPTSSPVAAERRSTARQSKRRRRRAAAVATAASTVDGGAARPRRGRAAAAAFAEEGRRRRLAICATRAVRCMSEGSGLTVWEAAARSRPSGAISRLYPRLAERTGRGPEGSNVRSREPCGA